MIESAIRLKCVPRALWGGRDSEHAKAGKIEKRSVQLLPPGFVVGEHLLKKRSAAKISADDRHCRAVRLKKEISDVSAGRAVSELEAEHFIRYDAEPVGFAGV